MAKSQAPAATPAPVEDEFKSLEEPTADPAAAPPEVPPPAPPMTEEEGEKDAQVVVEASAPRAPAAWRVLAARRVTIRGCVVHLKPGRVFREDHYDPGFIDQLKAGGVELERVS